MKKAVKRILCAVLSVMLITGASGCGRGPLPGGSSGTSASVIEENKETAGPAETVPAEQTAGAQNSDGVKETASAAGKEENAEVPGASGRVGTAEKASDAAPDTADAGKGSVKDSLPSVGDTVHGFSVKEIRDFPQKDAKIVSMEHEKSGAELLYIACDDPDKAFSVYYRTAASSDQGIPHVFEHITLSGSGKYPSADLWDEIQNGTYNTYMNAFTARQLTGYVMSSLSEDQLLAIMDFYMDGLTDPLALRDEHPLRRESFRYELNSPDDDITVTGAVFNEMEASNADRETFAGFKTLKLLYPDSIMSFNSGGYRDDILTITLEELKEYYEKYYHPSNMLIVMYGNLDCGRFLEALDRDYLSRYDRKEIRVTDDAYVPWTGFREGTEAYPVTEDSSEEGGGMVVYAVSLGEMSQYERGLMAVISMILSAESSPLKKRMQQEFPGASFDVSLNEELTEPVIYISLTDSNKGDAGAFHEAVDEALAEIFRDGLDKQLIDPIVDHQKLGNILSAEKPGGLTVSQNMGAAWAINNDPFSYLDRIRAVEDLRKAADEGKLDEMLAEYLKDPARSVLVEVNPEPGLKEAEDRAFREKLAAKKAGMSEEEIADMVAATEEFNAWSEASRQNSLLDRVKAVKVKDLPEEVVSAEAEETEKDGIRRVTSVIAGAPYYQSGVYLDAGTLDYSEIHDFIFLGELLGRLATEEKSPEELETALISDSYRYSIGPVIIYDDRTGEPHPYLSASFTGLKEQNKDAWELFSEILLRTDFSDRDRIRYLASGAATGFAVKNSQSPASIALNTALAAADPLLRYSYHANYFDYYAYLKAAAAMNDEETEALADRLRSVLTKLLNRNHMICTCIGDQVILEDDFKEAEAFAAKLSDTVLPQTDYTADLAKINLPKSIAVTVPGSVNYNGYAAAHVDTGFADNGTDAVVMELLHSKLLYPAFRYDMGAYGFEDMVGKYRSYIMTYRDPEVAASFRFFDDLPDKVADLEVSGEDVNDAVLSSYSRYAYPESPLDAADTAVSYVLQGSTETYAERTLRKMKNAKQVTPEDVKASAEKFQKLIENGVRISAGNSAVIRENRVLYELVIEDLTK